MNKSSVNFYSESMTIIETLFISVYVYFNW